MPSSVTYDSVSGQFLPAAPSDAMANDQVASSAMMWNGTNWQRATSNLEVTALASAAVTATRNSGPLSNFNCRGVIVYVNVTAVPGSAPSTTISIQTVDPVGGGFTSLLTSAAITGTGLTQLIVYPGTTVAANLAASAPIPRTWRVLATHGNANSMTYSVTASLIL